MIKKLFFVSGAALLLITLIIISCRKDLRPDENKPPIAKAGDDAVIVLPLDSVKLDGRASKDPDGSIKEFLWAKISGPSSYAFTNPQSSNGVIRNLVQGIYQVELKVSDDEGLSARDTLLIMVDSAMIANHSPIANAGNDTVILLPVDSLRLDGSASFDAEGPIKEYFWSKLSGPSSIQLTDPGSAITVIKNLAKGIYQLELKVSDEGGLSAKDTVMITVDSIATSNHPPTASAGPDHEILVRSGDLLFDGALAFLDGSNSADPDNNISTYRWSMIPGASSNMFSAPDSVTTEVTFSTFGHYQIELRVTDAGGLLSRDTLTIKVIEDTSNRHPYAYAGPDQQIFLPTNTVTLDGSLSNDPDNSIAAWQWTKVSGPSSFDIVNRFAAQTQVTSLSAGVYQFELKVADEHGLFSIDTVQVSVRADCVSNRPESNVTMVPIGKLSKPRAYMTVATASNKILFAGGISEASPADYWGSSRVDIYDIATNTWSTTELSSGRYGMTAVSAGNKILFAGGFSGELGDITQMYHSTIDIYDVSTKTWTLASLSEPGFGPPAAALGNKVFFVKKGKVEIFDVSANTWTNKVLPEANEGVSVVAVDNKVYFAGGVQGGSTGQFSSRIDIYDIVSNSWSVSTLSEPKAGLSGIAVNNKIYWAGGYNKDGELCTVEIRDIATQTTSFQNLSQPYGVRPVLKDNKISFHPFTATFDIYNSSTNTWTIGVKPNYRPDASLISVNNTVYMAGGYMNQNYSSTTDQVWKLEF